MAFLLLAIAYLSPNAKGGVNAPIEKAGGFFALLAAFLAWYNALAGILDDSNRYALFLIRRVTRANTRQLFHRPRCALPLVRYGYGEAWEARCQWQGECLSGFGMAHLVIVSWTMWLNRCNLRLFVLHHLA